MSFGNKDSTPNGRKFWNRLKKFSSLFKRHSTNGRNDRTSNPISNSDKRSTKVSFLMNFFSSRGNKAMFRIHPPKKLIIEEIIEEIEMKNLQSSLPKTEELDPCLDVVAYLDKQISVDKNTVSENTTLIEFLPSTSFQKLNPLMSPVTQKKLIAHAKIEKLKNSIQRGWEINRHLDEAQANFVRKKPGKKKVRLANPLVSEISDDEEDSGLEISLSERIQIFMDEVENLERKDKSNGNVEHLLREKKENLIMDVETSEDGKHL
ncbi:uncharacterized protein LOC117172100 [Belonocnema kinseyi]|uniref:uncharacterized protein LOC117172100 n=1 Tax=Belonocnema kinseyi TaxID=2817044 RepID=UPI00143DCAB3|nr:uncharacterized protein LOC117172100 [Belonocnema kinseyi]